MKKLLFIAILWPYRTYGQHTHVVVDSTTKEPVSYALIYFNDTGMYADDEGKFKIVTQNIDTLKIACLGYQSKKIPVYKIKDTIYLSKKSLQLNPVVINGSKKPLNIAPGKKARNFGSYPVSPETTIAAIIYPKKECTNRKIKRITLPFGKKLNGKSRRELRRKNINVLVRFHIYNVTRQQIDQNIFNSKVLQLKPYKKGELTIDLGDENIVFAKEGIAIALEVIKFAVEKTAVDTMTNKPLIRPLLTAKKNSCFDAQTYIKYTFKGKSEGFIPLNKELNNPAWHHKKKYLRNLSIGLTLN